MGLFTNIARRHIPEALLFYIFYALAKGLWAMEDGPFGDYSTPHKHIPYAFVVHRDMKPPNSESNLYHRRWKGSVLICSEAFLGYTPAPSQPFSEADSDYLGFQLKYPHAKIADFGLSEITNYSSDVNMMSNHRAGTPMWFPPVSWPSFETDTVHTLSREDCWPARCRKWGQRGLNQTPPGIHFEGHALIRKVVQYLPGNPWWTKCRMLTRPPEIRL